MVGTMEGRRHSIDVPISRTLIALRRVKSLRDPSTNSMTKLSTLVDNLNWDTNSNNAITLGFENSCCVGDDADDIRVRAMAPSADCDEGVGSCNEWDEVLNESGNRRPGWTNYRDIESSRVTGCDVLSHAGSPCWSIDKAPNDGAVDGMTLYRNSDVGMMEFCHQGCGISSCWSRPTKFRESKHLTDEEQPLMLSNAETRNSEFDGQGVSPFGEIPRNFCQKFTPKSFNELIGQKNIASSLLSAIERRQVASLYLFHGPRGTGKTSAARVFAAALNCLSPDIISRPCGFCQECDSFFSGRSRDVKEVDSVRINRKDKCRLLVESLRIPPVLSKYKVYIIDESHLLHRETWAIILNSIEELSRCVVVMVAPNLDKLPHSVVSRSQKYHFQNVKAVDIATRLGELCVQEGLDFDIDALNFISAKSNGSLRDALMMLDQMSLLGKKITLPMVYEVNGFVSNDELLDLLHLALSSDAPNTVKKTRELLGSRIDPLQLISQLANLIMDILADKCPDGVSDAKRKLLAKNNSEADLQQLSYALKILLQTEKQLRTVKNQTTWLTAALLQLSSTVSLNDGSDSRLSVRTFEPHDGDFLSTSSAGVSDVLCPREDAEHTTTGMQDDIERLQIIWFEAIGMCSSSCIKKFLQKHGKLVSICLGKGLAVAELEFDRPGSVSKAEKSWKVIAGALQHTLGYNVELRINLAENASDKFKRRHIISLFNCSRRMPHKSPAETNYVETCSSEGCTRCHGKEVFKTLRGNDGNALSIGEKTPTGPDPYGTYPLNKLEIKPSPKGCSKLCRWRTVMLRLRRAWKLKHEQQN